MTAVNATTSARHLSSSVWCWSSYAEVSFQWHPEAARATNTQQIWRQEFLGGWSSAVERSSTRTAVAGTFLRFFQTIFENTSLWRLKRLVSVSTYRRYINKCIYLSIYLLTHHVKCHRRNHGSIIIINIIIIIISSLCMELPLASSPQQNKIFYININL